MKTHFLSLLTFCCFLLNCQKQQSQEIAIVDAPTFLKKMEVVSQPQLVDVRTPEEFNAEHIPGATNINWNGASFVSESEKLDKTKPVFVYCKSGGRSHKAVEKLKELGFETIYELDGGFMQWSSEGFKSN